METELRHSASRLKDVTFLLDEDLRQAQRACRPCAHLQDQPCEQL